MSKRRKPSAPLFGATYGQGVVSTRTLQLILDKPSTPAVRRWLKRRGLLKKCFRDGGRLLVPVDILTDYIPGVLEASRLEGRQG